MASKPVNAFDVFISYARQDKQLLDKLVKQLSLLEREGLIRSWSDLGIDAGKEWADEIRKHLETAHIILLLISPDFIASDYCYSVEMLRALERHDANDARVIPVILRPVDWEKAPFRRLQALPTHGKPITTSVNRDQAFADVARGIRRAVEDLCKEQYLKEGNTYRDASNYGAALDSYQEALRLDPSFSKAYYERGITLRLLKRYEEALAAFDQALHLAPNYAQAYKEKGITLHLQKRYKEALAAFDQALLLDPNDSWISGQRGWILLELRNMS